MKTTTFLSIAVAAVFLFASPAAAQTVEQTLIHQRYKLGTEMKKNPSIRKRLIYLTHKEVGSQGDAAQQMFIETVMNRAYARKMTLAKTMNSKYYPPLRSKMRGIAPRHERKYALMIDKALEGSNLSHFATDNASNQPGNKLAAKRKKQGRPGVTAGGEFFYVDGPHIWFYKKMTQLVGRVTQ